MKTSKLVQDLRRDFPQFQFVVGPQAYWSPETHEIYYNISQNNATSSWSLLHELGHAVLQHNSYTTDIDLLQKEVEAWIKASTIAKKYKIMINEEYAQNCLETYRNWLFKRSTCPACGAHGAQNTNRQYCCFNCDEQWNVSISRFCRPYRGKTEKGVDKKNSQEYNSWLFVESAPLST
jgi:hypothetical protein